jgi:hypothetical protein
LLSGRPVWNAQKKGIYCLRAACALISVAAALLQQKGPGLKQVTQHRQTHLSAGYKADQL